MGLKKAMVVASMLAAGCVSFDGGIVPTSNELLRQEFDGWRYTAPNGVEMMVRRYLPTMEVPRQFPLIVYLHGAGQNGDDNERQLDDLVGCLHAFTHDREEYKSIIVAPQCPKGVYWRDERMLEALKSLVEFCSKQSAVCPDRVYITGFSMGGDASWKLALAYPSLMSTIVPVCGGPLASMEPDMPNVPDEMSNLNIWAFNNFDDTVVRPNYSKRVFARLWDMSDGDHLNFTESLEGGHKGRQAYSNRNLLIWMLSTKRRK